MYPTTVIDFNQLYKAKKRFVIGNRIILLEYKGNKIPVTQYIQDYWDKLDKNKEKPNYLEYLHQHNELKTFMVDLYYSKLHQEQCQKK